MLTSSSSVSLIRKYGDEETFRIFQACSIDAIDYPVDGGTPTLEALKKASVYSLSEDEVLAKFRAIREIADRHNVIVGQTHAIFGAFEPSDTDEFVDITIKDILATHVLGARHTVVHPIIMPGRVCNERKDENFEYNLKFYRKLIPALEKWNVKCAIENLFCRGEDGLIHSSECSDPQEILDYISELGSDNFCACADTGHFRLSGKDTGITVGDSMRRLGDALEVLHVQENDGIDDLHVVPFTLRNVMDWEDIISALREIGYNGNMNFEIMPFVKQFPDDLSEAAMAHVGNVTRYFAKRVGE